MFTMPSESKHMVRLAQLSRELEPFRTFARARLHDDSLADDAVQNALVKALRHIDTVQDESRLEAWFWSILRRTIIDLAQQRGRETGFTEAVLEPVDASPVPADVCACLKAVLANLPPGQRDILQALDLDGAAPASVAASRGVSTGTLAVQRHRARAALREGLERTCRTCAKHGCLDCTCAVSTD